MGAGPLLALAAGTAAAVCLGATAGAAAAKERMNLRVTQEHNAAGQTVVSVWMSTTADGNNTQATIFRQPGASSCQADPLRLWPSGSAQLLYGWTPYPARRWDRVVRFVETRAQRWTVCGYVVSEANLRFDLPYVLAARRATFATRAARPGAPRPGTGPWRNCPADPTARLLRLQARGSGSAGCQQAKVVYAAWSAQFFQQSGGSRNNFSVGWRRADGSRLRVTAPALRFSSQPVTALRRTLKCRETPVGSRELAPLDVDCEIARFRFR